MVQVDHVWTRITAYSNVQQYHSGLMALHKNNFYFFPQKLKFTDNKILPHKDRSKMSCVAEKMF